jgi:hypothetical protein
MRLHTSHDSQHRTWYSAGPSVAITCRCSCGSAAARQAARWRAGGGAAGLMAGGAAATISLMWRMPRHTSSGSSEEESLQAEAPRALVDITASPSSTEQHLDVSMTPPFAL